MGERLGMPDLALDGAGCCQLVFDEQWIVTLLWETSTQRLSLHCPVCSSEDVAGLSSKTLLAMLKGNFFGLGSGGITLSVAPDDRVHVHMALSLSDVLGGNAYNALDMLLTRAEMWAERLNRAGGPVLGGDAMPAWALQRV
jgi:hypothetical protein